MSNSHRGERGVLTYLCSKVSAGISQFPMASFSSSLPPNSGCLPFSILFRFPPLPLFSRVLARMQSQYSPDRRRGESPHSLPRSPPFLPVQTFNLLWRAGGKAFSAQPQGKGEGIGWETGRGGATTKATGYCITRSLGLCKPGACLRVGYLCWHLVQYWKTRTSHCLWRLRSVFYFCSLSSLSLSDILDPRRRERKVTLLQVSHSLGKGN